MAKSGGGQPEDGLVLMTRRNFAGPYSNMAPQRIETRFDFFSNNDVPRWRCLLGVIGMCGLMVGDCLTMEEGRRGR